MSWLVILDCLDSSKTDSADDDWLDSGFYFGATVSIDTYRQPWTEIEISTQDLTGVLDVVDCASHL